MHQPEKLRTPEQQAPLAAVAADVLVVAAYGIILPQAVLDHATAASASTPRCCPLARRGADPPRHRGRRRETGITIMQMDAGLDTGPMLLKRAEPIQPDDTTGSLHDRPAWVGARLIVEALEALPAGLLTATPQPAGRHLRAKIGKAEAPWWTGPARPPRSNGRSAPSILPRRAGRFDGTPVKLWRARAIDATGTPGEVLLAEGAGVIVACGEGALCITELQKPGARRRPPPISCAACRLRPVAAST